MITDMRKIPGIDEQTLADQAEWMLHTAGYDYLWPEQVRENLNRAVAHEGPFPPYAEKAVFSALSAARNIEQKQEQLAVLAEEELKRARRF